MSKRKITFMSLLEDYFETYLPYSRGLSSNTINSYKQSFLLLMRFMLEIKDVAASDISFVNTDELVHTARSSSACFPVFQCTLSAA
jgi:site-specific recombinase XerD